MSYLQTLSPEEREVMLAAAREKRAAKIADWKAREHLLKQGFKDLPHWRRLASRFGVRMPASYIPGAEGLKYVRRAIKATGVDFVDACACNLKQMAAINPTWPAYALVGLVLEQAHDEAGAPELPDVPEAELDDIQADEVSVIRTLDDIDEDDLV